MAGIALALSTLASSSLGQTYELVHAFRNSGQPAPPDGQTQSNLIQASDGYLYGTTYWGGTNGIGTIFRVDSAGNVTMVHSFAYTDGANPTAGLVQASDGNLYGTATRGGANNLGTVFRMDFSGNVVKLHSFDGADGKDPCAALIQAPDGNLYGTASSGGAHSAGTVFQMDVSGTFATLHSFDRYVDGARSAAGLLQAADGNFYGTTAEGGANNLGTVFKMDSAGTFTTVHTFSGSDGNGPYAALIQASDGNLYGTTSRGGTNGAGTVFKIDASGTMTTLHSFDQYTDGAIAYAALIQASDGDFYGTASAGSGAFEQGTVYRIDTSGNFTVLHRFDGTDGASPAVALVQAADGNFYGTTNTARIGLFGPLVAGTAFRMDSAGAVTTLHTFGWTDCADPEAALIQATDGSFYGTTAQGGTSNLGTIFKLDPSGGVTLVHSFDGIDGVFPRRLIQATDGNFYGTCAGVVNGGGTFFRMDASGHVTTLHAFGENDGDSPSDVIQATEGSFYGTTAVGGAGFGTAFKVDVFGNFASLCAFDPDLNGSYPVASLVQAGNFYGTTTAGGAYQLGTVFGMDGSGSVSALYSFGGPDGADPEAALVDADGILVGTTVYGGEEGFGTVFRIPPGSYDLDTIHTFNGVDGAAPRAIMATSGLQFYGTTSLGGAIGAGTVFTMDYDGNVTTLHSFDGVDGASPSTSLLQAADASFYGTARGGPFGDGVIFRLSTASISVNEVSPSSGPASGGVALDLLGGGFAPGAMVTVGGLAGTDVTVLDPTFLYLATPALSPGTLNDVSVSNPGSIPATATHPNAFFADFLDVPQTDPFHDFIERIFRKGITAGCAAGSYCPDNSVTRAQMAVFLLKSEHGSAYVPPACAGIFGDVPCPSLFADWIEQLAAEGITAGCGGGDFCPGSPVTRAQMAVFLLKTEHGPTYLPPPCTGVFADVTCPSLFADWIEQLAAENITGGCGGGNYCPDNPNTRGQMAVFLVKTFGL